MYNICILPIMLYGSECWALSKADARKIDALDQWCLRRILDICWYHRVSNREVRRMTEQPPLTDIIQKRRLMLFGHVARMDETADARRILTGVHQSDWSRPVGRPYTSWMATLKSDLSLHNLTFEDAIELALDKSLWRLLVASGATHWHGACRIMMMMMMQNANCNTNMNCSSPYRITCHICMQYTFGFLVTQKQNETKLIKW